MHILIDGHNLIPYIPGLNLRQMDDESALLALLQEYSRQSRNRIEVFFDGAPREKAGRKQAGMITVHAVAETAIADEAIRRRLAELGARARNCEVVSSDRQVQAEARARGAQVRHSDRFARELAGYFPQKKEKPAKQTAGKPAPPRPAAKLPDAEVQEWLRLFQSGKPEDT